MEEPNKTLVSKETEEETQRKIRYKPKVAPESKPTDEALAHNELALKASEAANISRKLRRRPKVAPSGTEAAAEAVAEAAVVNKLVLHKNSNKNAVVKDCSIIYDPCNKNILEKVDPLTGKENYDIKLLEKRVREIKYLRDKTPSGLYGLNNATSNYDFLMNVFCNKDISLDDMVSFRLQEGGQIGSDIFEVLCRLFVIFGGIDSVNILNGDFKIMTKIEDSTSIIPDVKTALETMKCKATSKMGVSDITLTNIKTTTKEIKDDTPYCEIECDVKPSSEIKTYLMSVKWYKEEKSAEHYDLEKLYLAGDNLVSPEKMPFGIIVFLKSKLDFQKAHRRSYRQYVSRIADTFFGWNEDVKPFLEDIRKTLFQNAEILKKTPQELIESQYLKSTSKPILSLQLHQDLIVTGINDLIENNPYNDNRYVIGVLPRGGKTFIAGGIIREYLNRNTFNDTAKINILWITAAPNETRSQVGNELILKFQDFDNFNFVDVKNLTDFSVKLSKPNTVWFCSIQLLTMSKAGRTIKRPFLDELLAGIDDNNKINMIFFDEAHYGGAGDKNKEIVDNLNKTYANIPFIFLTATYLGIIFAYNILTKTNLFVWDYTDVLKTRALGTESEREESIINLKLRFGDVLVSKIIDKRLANTDSYEAMAKPYMDFPELYFISCDFNDEAKDRFAKQDMYNPSKGFSLGSIFALKSDYSSFPVKTADNRIRKDAYKIFENLENPRNLISLITPSDPTQTFNFESPGGEPFKVDSEYEQTILKRIDRLSYETGSRFRIDEYPTILMFLPTGGTGTSIYKLLPAFAALLMSHNWWNKRYEVACVISDFDKNPSEEALASVIAEGAVATDNIEIIDNNLKSRLLKKERDLHCKNKKGLVILAGDRLSMGISLPCCDCVFLLNESKSPDDIIQKMYRALTPSFKKKSSFVVDLNPIRSLSAVYGYTRAAYESAVTKSKILDIIYNIYSWDEDIIDLKLEKGGSTRISSSQERLGKMLEDASKDTQYQKIFENIGGLDKKLAINITKKVNNLGMIPILRDIVIGKIVTKNGIKFSDKSSIIIKSGKVVIRLEKEKSDEEENSNDNEENVVEDVVIIQNFTEAVSDFLKYLAITSKDDLFDDALKEFEENIANNSGKSLQADVLNLLIAREAIQDYVYLPIEKQAVKNPIDKSFIVKLFVDVVRNYSPDTSREIFRQMRGKIEEPSTRKNEVLKIIHRHLTPKKSQKASHGEVFTPIEIIEKMFDVLPKSTWSNPDITFLDPANGIGNFPIIAFYKLNDGLKKAIPNEQKRKKHIIEKMLFMIEIQSNNTRIAKNIFSKLCEGCKPNIWTHNSLKVTSDSLEKQGWPTKYDIIMGNPPYQSGGTHQTGTTIWPEFITHYINFLNKDGHMTYINGQSWRELADNSKKAREVIRENNLIYTNILGNAFKGINYPVDFFVLKNNNKYTSTTIHNEILNITEDIDINDLPIIPNYSWDVFERWHKNKLPTLNVLRTYDTTSTKPIFSLTKTSKYKYPIVMNITGKEMKIKYSEKPHSLQNKIKVLVAFGSSLYPFVDKDGEYGLSENVFAIECSSITQANKIAKYLDEPIVKCLINALKIGTYAIKDKLLSILPDPSDFKSDSLEKNLLLSKDDITFLTKCSAIMDEVNSNVTKGGTKRFNKTRKNINNKY